jgi:hypothetical protein
MFHAKTNYFSSARFFNQPRPRTELARIEFFFSRRSIGPAQRQSERQGQIKAIPPKIFSSARFGHLGEFQPDHHALPTTDAVRFKQAQSKVPPYYPHGPCQSLVRVWLKNSVSSVNSMSERGYARCNPQYHREDYVEITRYE